MPEKSGNMCRRVHKTTTAQSELWNVTHPNYYFSLITKVRITAIHSAPSDQVLLFFEILY